MYVSGECDNSPVYIFYNEVQNNIHINNHYNIYKFILDDMNIYKYMKKYKNVTHIMKLR